MGCYGIGIGRLMAAAIEDSHDKHGPIWSKATAPFHVNMCVLDSGNENVQRTALQLYEQLANQNVEVLWDDTNRQGGEQFMDADLIGAPLRLIVSPRNVSQGRIEFKARDGSNTGTWAIHDAVEQLLKLTK